MSDPVTRLTPEGRFIRGAVGMVVTWVVVWGFVGGLAGLLTGILTPDGIEGTLVAGVIRMFLQLGFVCGSAFSVALAVAGRRRRFDQMPLLPFAVLGALVPILVFGAMGVLNGGFEWLFTPSGLGSATLLVLMGAGSSAGTLALARKAEDRELLEAGADVAEVGLTKEERHELLGK